MISPLKTNLIPLLQNLVASIGPFAVANEVKLRFETCQDMVEIFHNPENIIPDLTKVICRTITFTPQEYEVILKVKPVDFSKDRFLQVLVINTGVNLESIKKSILSGVERNVSVIPIKSGGTNFIYQFPFDEPEKAEETSQIITSNVEKKYIVSPFFKKLKTHLTSHFTSIRNLEKAASARSQKEGIFLKKVNAVILAHLDHEGFDTTSLSKAMALSRSQLYRRLKPLIRFAPAHYIRYVRLQKAKEFIEKEDVTAGEAAFRTGFINQSHFTRAFREQFGFNPSYLRRKKNEEKVMINKKE